VLATKEINIPRNSDGTGPLAYFEIVRENPQSLTFTFVNKSQNADFCNWSISPGGIPCGDISHTFATPGKYLIILYASNAEGTNCHREILEIDPVGG
jgi:PKD repeat protein